MDDVVSHAQKSKKSFHRDILKAENAAIRRRRTKVKPPIEGEHFGVALSGGGIRSASFSLGALQALHAYTMVPRIDYLSTVSGGGYIGASMVAAMARDKGKFPFEAQTPSQFSDSEQIRHIRNYSKYLYPKGPADLFLSLVIVMRGLAVNLVIILGAVLLLAALTVAANPAVGDLQQGTISWLLGKFGYAQAFPHGRFGASWILFGLLVLALGIWGVGKSWQELSNRDRMKDIASRITSSFVWAITIWLVILVIDINGALLHGIIHVILTNQIEFSALVKYLSVAAGYVTSMMAFREKLMAAVKGGASASTFADTAKSVGAAIALVLAALILPIVIYFFYVLLVYYGVILPVTCHIGPFSLDCGFQPAYFEALATTLLTQHKLIFIIPEIALTLAFAYFVWSSKRHDLRASWLGPVVAGVVLVLNVLLVCAYPQPALGLRGTLSPVPLLYLNAAFLLLLLSAMFSENANSLHGLYRDRLRDAFLRLKKNDDGKHIEFKDLDVPDAPYLIMNCALNARRSVEAKDSGQYSMADPVMRGRNAEFFFFSPLYAGSEATGYIESSKLKKREFDIDLATAVAICGAAVSSNMGKLKFTALSSTLALLNLRLGYWMKNPLAEEGGRVSTKWYHRNGLYLFSEMFGLLSTDAPKIYLTDGGHIENLGVYQLLKRRCPIIIAIEAEADPQYTFEALSDLERYARIDLGVRIDIDWKHVRNHALDGAAATSVDPRFCHFAIGTIHYPDEKDKNGKVVSPGFDGILLYVKSSVTGDEPDYVLDYQRRHPAFPQETTLDQFFSEDQMEAYRALGFHAMDHALNTANIPAAGQVPNHLLVLALKKRLDINVQSI